MRAVAALILPNPIPCVILCSVGTVLLTAVGLSITVVAIHGAFREPDNLFLDDSALDSQNSFFSIFNAPAPATGPANV